MCVFGSGPLDASTDALPRLLRAAVVSPEAILLGLALGLVQEQVEGGATKARQELYRELGRPPS